MPALAFGWGSGSDSLGFFFFSLPLFRFRAGGRVTVGVGVWDAVEETARYRNSYIAYGLFTRILRRQGVSDVPRREYELLATVCCLLYPIFAQQPAGADGCSSSVCAYPIRRWMHASGSTATRQSSALKIVFLVIDTWRPHWYFCPFGYTACTIQTLEQHD